MLKIQSVSSGYGQVQILHEVSLDVAEGEIVTLIGVNGAGKSTLLMTICGHPQAWSGSIIFDNSDITKISPHLIAHHGIAHVPEGRRIFPRMTVLENLKIGGLRQNDKTQFSSDLESVLTFFPILRERLKQLGGTLSGGEQQMLALARALMSRPRLLLLDEPSLGLAPLIVKQIFEILKRINLEKKTTILLVEQNAWHALHLAHRGYVLDQGRIALSGKGLDLLSNQDIQKTYLGDM
jgi:branched-chain amino acid transport system ATP-binding protein